MNRAYVGFSTPIGYDYNRIIPISKATKNSVELPNPLLLGATGMMCFYDEIWFVNEAQCPENMRNLDFVRFLEYEYQGLNLVEQGFEEFIDFDNIQTLNLSYPSLQDGFDADYNDVMRKLFKFKPTFDNHSRGVEFYNTVFQGNLGLRNLLADVWILSRFKNLDATLVANPFSAKALNTADLETLDVKSDKLLSWKVDSVVTVNNLFDLTNDHGPFHEVIMDLRNEPSIKAFRKWATA